MRGLLRLVVALILAWMGLLSVAEALAATPTLIDNVTPQYIANLQAVAP